MSETVECTQGYKDDCYITAACKGLVVLYMGVWWLSVFGRVCWFDEKEGYLQISFYTT
jgi:hypothetical protein